METSLVILLCVLSFSAGVATMGTWALHIMRQAVAVMRDLSKSNGAGEPSP